MSAASRTIRGDRRWHASVQPPASRLMMPTRSWVQEVVGHP
ncbi:hypothetical protein DP42_5620 [Burkholderia pseudomallei]|nr:hypothetical protein DP42_5620 [Burkholderia pseudomallei]KOT22853.1 hypothetical protein DM52_2488 [Burkholderia mallei]